MAERMEALKSGRPGLKSPFSVNGVMVGMSLNPSVFDFCQSYLPHEVVMHIK